MLKKLKELLQNKESAPVEQIVSVEEAKPRGLAKIIEDTPELFEVAQRKYDQTDK